MYILQNQKCVAEPSLNNLHVNEYTQALPYYPFAVFLDRCIGSCNTLNFNDLSNGVFVLNQTEDVDLKVFNMITETTESKTLTNTYHANINASLMVEIWIWIKWINWNCNLNQKWNKGKCWCGSKNPGKRLVCDICIYIYMYIYIYIYIYIYATCSSEISRSIIDDLVDICDEIIGTKKNYPNKNC